MKLLPQIKGESSSVIPEASLMEGQGPQSGEGELWRKTAPTGVHTSARVREGDRPSRGVGASDPGRRASAADPEKGFLGILPDIPRHRLLLCYPWEGGWGQGAGLGPSPPPASSSAPCWGPRLSRAPGGEAEWAERSPASSFTPSPSGKMVAPVGEGMKRAAYV